MASKLRGGLSKREWERANPGQKAPSSSDKKKKASPTKVDDSQLKALQSQVTKSLTPTQEETDTSTQLSNIITSKELGIQGVEQEPMAQKFVTGQSAGLEKSAALKSLPLQTRLANLQARRQSAADVLKAQLGFETSNVARQTGLAESAADRRFQQEQADISQQQFGQTFGESQRQFDANLSLSQQQESRLGGDSGNTDDLVEEGTRGIDSFFDGVKGRDGYVSPSDYAQARSQWVRNGLKASDFDARFGKWRNPNDKY